MIEEGVFVAAKGKAFTVAVTAVLGEVQPFAVTST
jgi:hypothetical protein